MLKKNTIAFEPLGNVAGIALGVSEGTAGFRHIQVRNAGINHRLAPAVWGNK